VTITVDGVAGQVVVVEVEGGGVVVNVILVDGGAEGGAVPNEGLA